jgi:hypothetical protein
MFSNRNLKYQVAKEWFPNDSPLLHEALDKEEGICSSAEWLAVVNV